MLDELNAQEENTATEETQPEKGTGTDQTKTGKTFTQEEMNKVVAKERATWKRQNEKATADHETIVDGLRKDIQARDEVILAQVELLKKDLELDEITAELLSEKDPLAQFQTLVKMVEKAGKQEMPRTPKGRKVEPEFQTSFRPRI